MGLVINRKVGEKLLIGEDLEMEITDVNGQYVKLHFTGKSNLRIERIEKMGEKNAKGKDRKMVAD